jgi:hypothetical protein
VLATFRYKHYIDRSLDTSMQERTWTKLNRDGITFLPADPAQGPRPSWYGETYHTPEYVRKNWGSYFEVRHTVTAETDAQEVVLLRVRESTFLQRVFQRS